MLHEAVITHRLPGRIRLKLPGLKRDALALGQIAEGLGLCPFVLGVEANPLLGSLLIRHQGDGSEVESWAEAQGLFRAGPEARETVQGRLREGVDGLARGLSAVSGQRLESREWLTLGLIGMAIHQAIEGNIMVPAVSLLWYAINTAGASGQPEGGPAPPGNE